MGAEVVVTSDAWRDLASIITHIAKDTPAAAERFSDKLLDTAQALVHAPFVGCRLKGFPGIRTTVHGRYLQAMDPGPLELFPQRPENFKSPAGEKKDEPETEDELVEDELIAVKQAELIKDPYGVAR